MATSDLDFLLVEYEQKKRDAEFNSQKRKEKIYKKIPRLEQIDEEINKISINKTKSILISQLTNSLNTEFENELLKLKKEKEEILKKENIDESYFKPNYECDKCKDTGYITYPDKKTEMCNCLKQKLINISYIAVNINNLAYLFIGKNLTTTMYYQAIEIPKYSNMICAMRSILILPIVLVIMAKAFGKNSGNTGRRFYITSYTPVYATGKIYGRMYGTLWIGSRLLLSFHITDTSLSGLADSPYHQRKSAWQIQ